MEIWRESPISEMEQAFNSSFYKIEDNGPRYIWAAYFIFVFFSSAIGDSIILVASLKYKAIKLNKLSLVVIEYIACCDLAVTIFVVLPEITSLIANGWVLGDFWACYFFCCVCYFLTSIGILNICQLVGVRLLIIKFPLKARSWSSKKATTSCSIAALIALIVPVSFALVNKDDVVFDYKIYQCNFGFSTPLSNTVRKTTSFLYLAGPCSIVVISTSWLLKIAWQHTKSMRKNLKWQGVISTIHVAIVFCISAGPYCIYDIKKSYFDKDPRSVFYRICLCCLYINTISNFFIYTLTISSFKQFLLLKTKPICPFRKKIRKENFQTKQQPMVTNSKDLNKNKGETSQKTQSTDMRYRKRSQEAVVVLVHESSA